MVTTELAAFVPRHVHASRLPPRAFAVAAAGVFAGSMGVGGLYPPYDRGELRFLVGAAAGVLAMLVVGFTLRAKTPDSVALRVAGWSVILGVVLAWVCGMILFGSFDPGSVLVVSLYAIPFGGIPGVIYGIILVVVAASAKTAELTGSADSLAGARGAAGIAVACGCLPGGGLVALMEGPGAWVPLAVGGLALVVASEAGIDVLRRRLWIKRVRQGKEPLLAVRPRTSADADLTLRRLSGDASVLELAPAPDRGAYRMNATRTPLAFV